MRIVHLTDIHLSKDNLEQFRNFYLDALINDLKKYNGDIKIDLIIITGDLVDKGGNSLGDYKKAYENFEEEFITPIKSALAFGNEKFLFIPGNHDVNREEINSTYELGLQAEIKDVENANQKIALFNNTFTEENKRIQNFKEFEQLFHCYTSDYAYSNNESIFTYDDDGFKFGFLLINDSWRCSSTLEQKNHYVGINQFFNANRYFKEHGTALNIVLLHHPLEFLNESEGNEIRRILQNFDFELVLFGHTHHFNLKNVTSTIGNTIFINSKSSFNDPREKKSDYQPGYNILDIDKTNLALKCHFRKFIINRYSFDADVDVAIGGEFETQFVTSGKKREFHEMYELATKTLDSHEEDFDRELLIFNTDTSAPKKIKELFVLPSITENSTSLVDKGSEKKYSLSDILKDEKNIILFGSKECGKTTLINRLSIEIYNCFSSIKKISVVIDLRKIYNDDILTLVRRYLNEDKKKVESLADNGSLVLLIDNFSEDNKLKFAKNKLKYFIRNYPKSKAILMSSDNVEEVAQDTESIANDTSFKSLYIGNVGLKEFKLLAFRWFNIDNTEWYDKNINKLIDVFKILKIPRTFFSITLFLWIIEKQSEFKPVNKSYLVNKFLQYILEGFALDEGQAGAFNFERKKEILSEIALEMLRSGNELESYSLSEDQIIKVIIQYIEINQRTFYSVEVYKLFLEKGIFKTEIFDDVEKVCFRFESFFQFFLSLNIDSNKEFKEHVFDENNILSFIEEIDYYTGRHVSSKEVLEKAIGLLKKSFQDLDDIIDDNTDKYLPSKLMLLDKVDENTITSKITENTLTDQKKEELYEKQLDRLPVNDSIQVKMKYNAKTDFFKFLELCSRVIKNAENIRDPNLINETLDSIITYFAKYSIYIQSILAKIVLDTKEKVALDVDSKEAHKFFENLISVVPLINQALLTSWIGTSFLQVPLKTKIDDYLNLSKVHQFRLEQFICLLVYVDQKLPNYIQLLSRAVKQIDNKYIAELYFFKVLSIYKITSSKSNLLENYKELLSILIGKIKNVSKDNANKAVNEKINEITLNDKGNESDY